jgi:hypothetical protein
MGMQGPTASGMAASHPAWAALCLAARLLMVAVIV